jgi:hypothetical protein
MQSQSYFYQRLRLTSNDNIKAALATMPAISEKTKALIIEALDAGNDYYARHELANWLHSSLTLKELGIELESAIWKQWGDLTNKK